MLTIAGNGMGDYTFNNISLDLTSFDIIVCDENFKEDGKNILKFNYKYIKQYILDNYKDKNLLYVVTGSPFFYSAGNLMAQKIPKEYVKIIDNISCEQYIQQKMLISGNYMESITLHGRNILDLTRFLTNRYTFILCDKNTIDKLRFFLQYIDKSKLNITIGYKLGYEDEVIEQINIDDVSKYDLTQPYVIIIETLFTRPKSEDKDFITQNGMITKKYKRDLSLQNLDLEPNQILWDIGAGSGSCAIEAYKRYKVKTILFEKQPQRVENIKINLQNHFVCETKLLEGNAEDLFNTIEQNPQRIFIGGGGEKVIQKLPYLYDRLDDNGILLINIVTLKHLALIIDILNNNKINYEIISINLTIYKGNLNMAEPQREMYQIKIIKNTL